VNRVGGGKAMEGRKEGRVGEREGGNKDRGGRKRGRRWEVGGVQVSKSGREEVRSHGRERGGRSEGWWECRREDVSEGVGEEY